MLTIASPAAASGGAALTAPPEPEVSAESLPDAPQIDRQASARRTDRRELLENLRVQTRRDARPAPKPAPKAVAVSPALQAIAQCESGGNPAAIGGGGAFRGKYQFTFDTWAAVGGSGDPAKAPEAEQDRRAAALYSQSGPGQWPVCGQ
jgi:hypothetical protein